MVFSLLVGQRRLLPCLNGNPPFDIRIHGRVFAGQYDNDRRKGALPYTYIEMILTMIKVTECFFPCCEYVHVCGFWKLLLACPDLQKLGDEKRGRRLDYLRAVAKSSLLPRLHRVHAYLHISHQGCTFSRFGRNRDSIILC